MPGTPTAGVRDRATVGTGLHRRGFAVPSVLLRRADARRARGRWASKPVAPRRVSFPSLPRLGRSGVARLIGRGEWSRFCSRAGGLPPQACARSPARSVGGLSSRGPREPVSRCHKRGNPPSGKTLSAHPGSIPTHPLETTGAYPPSTVSASTKQRSVAASRSNPRTTSPSRINGSNSASPSVSSGRSARAISWPPSDVR